MKAITGHVVGIYCTMPSDPVVPRVEVTPLTSISNVLLSLNHIICMIIWVM